MSLINLIGWLLDRTNLMTPRFRFLNLSDSDLTLSGRIHLRSESDMLRFLCFS